MERLTRRLTWLVRAAIQLMPPDRRQWVQAVLAEAEQVPAGWSRLSWIGGGLWLAAKEANVARKIGYWLGVGAIAAMAAWTAWLSLRTASGSDAEAVTDRFRILVTLTALVALPWLGRQRGLFGPVAPGVLPRFVRIAGCTAICTLGAMVVHLDAHAKSNGVGNGRFNPVQEIAGLAALAVAVAAPFVIKARWPQAGREVSWSIVACAIAAAIMVVPLQLMPVAYLALIFAATSRRSPVRSGTLVAGLAGGLLNGLIAASMPALLEGPWTLIALVLSVAAVCTILAGAAAAWLVRDPGTADELWAARVRQGMFAGIMAGAVGGLVPTLFLLVFAVMMVLGPLTGALGGRFGGALAAGRLSKHRPDRSVSAGLFVSN